MNRTALIARPGFQAVAAPVIVGVLALLAWEIACRAFAVPTYLVPSPSAIVRTLVTEFGPLSRSLRVTLQVTFQAFALAVVLGSLIAFAFAQSRWIELGFFPYAVLLQVTPVAAVAPLIIIWVKDTTTALTVCATVVALFPIISNTSIGLHSVNPGLVSLFRMNRATRLQTLVRLRIPSALPYWFGGLRISCGLALIGAVAAEFVAGTGGQDAGLAYQILQAGFQIDIPRLFAALFMITVTGVVLFAAMVALSRLALARWHDSEAAQER